MRYSIISNWSKAKRNVEQAQKQQKKQFDKKPHIPIFSEGDWVLVLKPAAKSCKAYKFARPFHGLYRIVKLYDNGTDIWPVNRPQEAPIRVPFDRLWVCPEEIPNQSWAPKSMQFTSAPPIQNDTTISTQVSQPNVTVTTPTAPTVWEGQLRKRWLFEDVQY